MSLARKNRRRHPARNHGAALLLLLLMVVVVFSMALIAPLAGNHPEIQRQQATLEALAQAKQALIAWSVTQGDVGADNFHRPGTLPCPDKNFFGGANSGNASGSCSTDGGTSIGRLPWRSLGVERLRDAYGETLWYAVSDNFRNPNLSKAAINSDAEGALLLYAADGSTLTTPTGEELAAIVLAPGPPLPGQDRAALPDAASSYLDAFNGKNNANAAGPFIMGPAKDSNGHLVTNDFVVGITARELVSALEQRALNEARNALKEYAEEHGHYPNPAPPNAANCASSVINVEASPFPQCASDSATCFGRLPEDALAPYVLPWFLQNGWGRVMIYAINDSAAACATSLNVEKKPKSYVLIAPGTARNGQSRPSLSLSNYLEDSGNADAWSANPDFFVPGINSNDQMRTEP